MPVPPSRTITPLPRPCRGSSSTRSARAHMLVQPDAADVGRSRSRNRSAEFLGAQSADGRSRSPRPRRSPRHRAQPVHGLDARRGGRAAGWRPPTAASMPPTKPSASSSASRCGRRAGAAGRLAHAGVVEQRRGADRRRRRRSRRATASSSASDFDEFDVRLLGLGASRAISGPAEHRRCRSPSPTASSSKAACRSRWRSGGTLAGITPTSSTRCFETGAVRRRSCCSRPLLQTFAACRGAGLVVD